MTDKFRNLLKIEGMWSMKEVGNYHSILQNNYQTYHGNVGIFWDLLNRFWVVTGKVRGDL